VSINQALHDGEIMPSEIFDAEKFVEIS